MKETKFRKTKTKTGMEEAAIYWRKANLVSLVLSLEVPRHVMGTHSSTNATFAGGSSWERGDVGSC